MYSLKALLFENFNENNYVNIPKWWPISIIYFLRVAWACSQPHFVLLGMSCPLVLKSLPLPPNPFSPNYSRLAAT